MPASHVKSITIPDGGDANVGRPSDWLSDHNEFVTLGGNTFGNSTVSGPNVVWEARGNLSLGGSTASIVLSGPGPNEEFEPFAFPGGSTSLVSFPVATSGSLSLFYLVLDRLLSAGIMDIAVSVATVDPGFATFSGTNGLRVGLYTRMTGTDSSRLSLFSSISLRYVWSLSENTITVNMPNTTSYSGYSTRTTSGFSNNLMNLFAGGKLVGIPISQLMTPGEYWLGLLATGVASSFISWSYVGAVPPGIVQSCAPMGSFSTAFSLGYNEKGQWWPGHGVWTSAGSVTGMPNSVAFTSITRSLITHPYIQFHLSV